MAENRGKTLYCGIDQSDTFTKAETWEAGRDRNERDDTVYFGERGQFRGFIAAQEGWLTEGESGVTGVSIDRIFEFPREEKKRRRNRVIRPNLVYDREYPDSQLAVPGVTTNPHRGTPPGDPGPTAGYLTWNRVAGSQEPAFLRSARMTSPAAGFSGNAFVRALGPAGFEDGDRTYAENDARGKYVPPTDAQAAEWALNGSGETGSALVGVLEVPGGANEECRGLGYARATRVKWWYQDSDGDGTPDLFLSGDIATGGDYQYRAWRSILYTARCVGRS